MRALALLAVLAACGNDPCDPNAQACTYEQDVSTITVPAGFEDEDTCQSWTLNNPTELWVHSITQHSRVIGSSHFLNASDADITTTMHLRMETIPPPQVAAKLAPARIQYHDLHLDPNARSAFTTECTLDTEYTK